MSAYNQPQCHEVKKGEAGSAGILPATSQQRKSGRRDACAPRLYLLALIINCRNAAASTEDESFIAHPLVFSSCGVPSG